MIIRFHGIDKHKKYSTISLLNRKGEEIDFKLKSYPRQNKLIKILQTYGEIRKSIYIPTYLSCENY